MMALNIRAACVATLACSLCAACWTTVLRGDEAADQSTLKSFLAAYCVDCHQTADPAGERAFDELAWNDLNEDSAIDLRDIVDQLTLGDMPPLDEKQPTASERQKAIESATMLITSIRQRSRSTQGRTVMRRLNRREYLRTVGDLLQMDMTMFDPTTNFPADSLVDHFDTVGDSLVMSGYQLEQYLAAAEKIVAKVFDVTAPVLTQTWTFRSGFKQQPELDTAHKVAFGQRFLCLYDCPQAEKPEGAFGHLHAFQEGVPVDGQYEVRVLAQSLHRDSPYSPKVTGIDGSEPFRLGIVPGSAAVGTMHLMQPLQPLLAEAVVADGPPQWITAVVPLDKGFSPRFTFQNGLPDARSTYGRVFRLQPELVAEPERKTRGIFEQRIAVLARGYQPQIRIHEVQIRGPLESIVPTRSQRVVLGKESLTEKNLEAVLVRFADRAYRRPPTDDEVSRLLTFVGSQLRAGRSAIQTLQDGLIWILCSPGFLYMEPITSPSGQASATALATRLSYFLTSSMPDEHLRDLARDGELLQSDVLRGEVRRLLGSDRSDAMVVDFLDGWLNLRDLGKMPPDREAFGEYYHADLRESMRRETFLFTRDLIDRNRPVHEFLDANHSYVNRDLAKLYGVEDQVPIDDGHRFRAIEFPDARRGGLLGQASVLTVSANGIETSPVIRGIWMLETVLGTPPAPPPDDVPAIDPDVRGAVSIRDLLEKHRQSPACNECHRKIDPLGFALESFDPIGRYRTQYENRAEIDPSGVLPSGQTFDDVTELKELLIERQPFFARCLTEKLFIHALGRLLEPSDDAAIDQLLDELAPNQTPIASLIEAVVLSDRFRESS